MASSPDTGRRSLRPTGPGTGLVAVAAFGAAVWVLAQLSDDGNEPLLVASLALILLAVLDAVSAWRAVTPPPWVAAADDGVAGYLVPYAAAVPALRRPVTVGLLEPPGARPLGWVPLADRDPATALLPTPPRGVYPWQVFEVRARGPLGLVAARRRHRLGTPLVVGPAPVPHPLTWPPPPASVAVEDVLRAPGEDLFRGVREYRHGDPRRAVHWRATAHHGSLMVREHEATGVRTLCLVTAHLTPGAAAEAALGRAAWLAADALRRGWRVRLVTCEASHPPPPAGPLRRSTGPLGSGPPPGPGIRTVDRPVPNLHELARRLAVAVPGPPARSPAPDRLVTRWVSPEGDAWL